MSISAEEAATPQDLIARVLLSGTRRILKDGLDRGYRTEYEETARLRGRVDFGRTVGRILLQQAKAALHHDEFTHNILHNRILKSTIAHLASVDDLDAQLVHDLRELLRRFDDVDTIRLRAADFRRVQLHRNNAFYAFLMSTCEFAFFMILAGEGGGEHRFRDFVRDEERMHRVFQDFVYNFFRIEQTEFSVRAEGLRWTGISLDQESANFLPTMTTDVALTSPHRKIVIDTKYYSEAFQENFGKRSIRSGHLFQIFAYLKNSESVSGTTIAPVEGCLLYPSTVDDFDLRYVLHGHPLRVMSVDLRKPWAAIAKRLMGLLVPPSNAGAAS